MSACPAGLGRRQVVVDREPRRPRGPTRPGIQGPSSPRATKFVVTGTPGATLPDHVPLLGERGQQLVGPEPAEVQVLPGIGQVLRGPRREDLLPRRIALAPERRPPGVVQRGQVRRTVRRSQSRNAAAAWSHQHSVPYSLCTCHRRAPDDPSIAGPARRRSAPRPRGRQARRRSRCPGYRATAGLRPW